MKVYLISLAAGLLVGVVYSLLGVRSPAPPMVALVGLLGILLGEQIIPLARRVGDTAEMTQFVQTECREHILGHLPGDPAEARFEADDVRA